MLIPGRIAMYEIGLLSVLENTNHEIDLYLSLNGEYPDCEYYKKMQNKLGKWIKGLFINKFELDEEFCKILKPSRWPNRTHCKNYKNYFVPYNPMSMFFNEKNAFKMATDYADKNNFEYDCYMKFRPDITPTCNWESLEMPDKDMHIYSSIPFCDFTGRGKHQRRIVSDAWAYGNRKSMNVYCSTYDYILQETQNSNGLFFISFECTLVDCLVDNNITWEYTHLTYNHLNFDRKLNDFERE